MEQQIENLDLLYDELVEDTNDLTKTTLEESDLKRVDGTEPAQGGNVEDSDDPSDTNEDDDSDLDAFGLFLKSRGFRDGNYVLYENETGDTEEVDFSSLTKEEQLSILEEIAKPNLSKDEIETINYLRTNKTTLVDVVKQYQEKALEEYTKQLGNEKQYAVDDYSDDELYIADLKQRFPNLSDEDLTSDLDIAKTNEELFKLKVEKIKEFYKSQEDQEAVEKQQLADNQYKEFQNNVVDQLTAFNSISLDYTDANSDSLGIEDTEKDKIFEYIFNKDIDGSTNLFKDLKDPQILVELAWYKLYGKDAISNISKY